MSGKLTVRRVRGFFVVWLRLRKNAVVDFETMRAAPWWSFRAWWSVTKMWWGPFKRGADFRG